MLHTIIGDSCCGPRAIAAITGKTVQEIEELFLRFRRPSDTRKVTITNRLEHMHLLNYLGYNTKYFPRNYQYVRQVINLSYDLQVFFLVYTDRHVFSLFKGKTSDGFVYHPQHLVNKLCTVTKRDDDGTSRQTIS